MKHLDPVDLSFHIRMGRNALLGGLDPTQRHMPYWNWSFKNGDITELHHSGAWDRCHDVARAIHALAMAEEATGEPLEEAIVADLSDHLFALFDEADGLPGTPADDTGKRWIHLHNVREATHALTALVARGDARAEVWARKMVRVVRQALDDAGKLQPERLPAYVDAYSSQPGQEGRAVDALLRYYRVSGDEAALELALLMTAYALEHCFTPAGAVTEAAGGHGHSITALLAGMADLALLTNDAALLRRVKAIYDVGMPRFNSSFGWSLESLVSFNHRGESNNTGDLLRAALLLARAGYPEYYGCAERILRGHLLPSQVLDADGFSDDPNAPEDRLRSLASRARGGFSFPAPNDLLVNDAEPIVTYDITSGAVDGLCEAWKAILSEDDAGVRVNLLLSREGLGLRVRSYLSREGRVEVENGSGRNLLVRVPEWAPREEVRVLRDGAVQTPVFVGAYLLVPAKREPHTVAVAFPMREERAEESVCYRRYTIDWRGDQIVAMSPPGQHLPMFPPCA